MRITRRQLRKIVQERIAHPRDGLGKNIADAEFPIVVGYNLRGQDQSEIAYNQDELDDILDDVANSGMPYSLDSLEDMEPGDRPVGSDIEQYTEGKMRITRRQLRNIIRESLNEQGNIGASAELTQGPDREAVSAAWPDGVTHNGENVFKKFYDSVGPGGVDDAEQWMRDEGYDGQEVYLGYDPQSDMFVMGFDAFLEYDQDSEMEAFVVGLSPDGRARETITTVPGGFYSAGHRAVKTAMPQIIDVRLD